MVCSPSPDLDSQSARLYDSRSLIIQTQTIQTLTILNRKTAPQTSFRKKTQLEYF